jgi:hypothetical protein
VSAPAYVVTSCSCGELKVEVPGRHMLRHGASSREVAERIAAAANAIAAEVTARWGQWSTAGMLDVLRERGERLW